MVVLAGNMTESPFYLPDADLARSMDERIADGDWDLFVKAQP